MTLSLNALTPSPAWPLNSSPWPITPTGDRLSISDTLPCISYNASLLPLSPHSNVHEDRGTSSAQSARFFDTSELDLLSHYLSHTSKTIPFDALDLYALSIGIPNLAFRSKPVMSSLIALAATCKSHDIVKQRKAPLDGQTLVEVQGLLELAESHHRSSLRHIQATVAHSDWYDEVLANAALMVLYASACHSIRVHLASSTKQTGQHLPDGLLPQHSQWISFTRAAHTASTAVLNDVIAASNKRNASRAGPETPSQIPPDIDLSDREILSPQNGPLEDTERLFLPLVASTYVQAFDKLSERANSLAARLVRTESPNHDWQELDACLQTLPVLTKHAFAALSPRKESETSTDPGDEPLSFERQGKVSPWVAKYMISVTSMKAPRALRRTIMSFLNEAPSGFLNIVQSILDLPPTHTSTTHGQMGRDSLRIEIPPLYATQLLAMDIFGHWLVLVMLLDGVWWIGDIGKWELGQVVSLMKAQNYFRSLGDDKATWWPQSMYMIKLELR